MQQEINFNEIVLHNENNAHSEAILLEQAPRLSNNCKVLYEALLRGERLTGLLIMQRYNMIEYRRRMKDLKSAGVEIKENKLPNGCKEWYLK